MKKLFIIILYILLLTVTVNALEYTAPSAPDSAEEYINENTQSFAEGLLFILQQAAEKIYPNTLEAGKVCFSLIGICIFVSAVESIAIKHVSLVHLLAITSISIVLMRAVNSMIHLGSNAIYEISEYGKMFVPVMTAALAAQGATTTSATLYAGTVFFNSLLSTLIAKLLVPVIYIYLTLCIANRAIKNTFLQQMANGIKWLMTWGLKIILYIFTGYLSITGVISGSTDASLLKATKIMISGAVPVVGNIISDASDSILISAGIMKNAAGVYGMLAIIALCIGPFIKIGVHYLMLKMTAGIGGMFVNKQVSGIVEDFSSVMGLILAMVGTVCVLLLVSTVCFMKGVT